MCIVCPHLDKMGRSVDHKLIQLYRHLPWQVLLIVHAKEGSILFDTRGKSNRNRFLCMQPQEANMTKSSSELRARTRTSGSARIWIFHTLKPVEAIILSISCVSGLFASLLHIDCLFSLFVVEPVPEPVPGEEGRGRNDVRAAFLVARGVAGNENRVALALRCTC